MGPVPSRIWLSKPKIAEFAAKHKPTAQLIVNRGGFMRAEPAYAPSPYREYEIISGHICCLLLRKGGAQTLCWRATCPVSMLKFVCLVALENSRRVR